MLRDVTKDDRPILCRVNIEARRIHFHRLRLLASSPLAFHLDLLMTDKFHEVFESASTTPPRHLERTYLLCESILDSDGSSFSAAITGSATRYRRSSRSIADFASTGEYLKVSRSASSTVFLLRHHAGTLLALRINFESTSSSSSSSKPPTTQTIQSHLTFKTHRQHVC